jgi:tRNA dimethylallyltransferase
MGTTASGKTGVAEELADHLDARLVNADAFQVYRYLDIGTAKSARADEYALLNIRHPNETFGLGEWSSLATQELHALYAEAKSAVVVGGTGLYIRALFEQYADMAPAPDPVLRAELDTLSLENLKERLELADPASYGKVDLLNRVRVQRALERALTPSAFIPNPLPPFKKFKFAIDRDPEETRSRIAERVHEMVRDGWVDEVRALMDMGYHFDDPGLRAHGYRHIWRAVEGTMDMAQALDLTINEVRRYARRQRTWLRKEPELIWVEPDDPLKDALRHLSFIEE